MKESVCTVHHRFGYRTDPIGDRTASLLSKRACSNSGQLVWWVNRAARCVAVRQSHRTMTGAVTVRAVRRSHINLVDAPLVTSRVTSLGARQLDLCVIAEPSPHRFYSRIGGALYELDCSIVEPAVYSPNGPVL